MDFTLCFELHTTFSSPLWEVAAVDPTLGTEDS